MEKGDLTRITHRPDKHYAKLRWQQGRAILDADLNEQQDILEHLRHAQNVDVIGPTGAPREGGGFQVKVDDKQNPPLLVVTPGRLYVEGVLCELEGTPVAYEKKGADTVTVADWNVDGRPFAKDEWVEISTKDASAYVRILATPDVPPGERRVLQLSSLPANLHKGRLRRVVAFHEQPDARPGPYAKPPSGTARTDMVYLRVRQRTVLPLHDPHIQEVALQGADTALRVRTEWQVKIRTVPQGTECSSDVDHWPPEAGGGRLSLDVVQEEDKGHPCDVPQRAGYKGLRNQLYRIEIHDPGDPYPGRVSGRSNLLQATKKEGGVMVATLASAQPVTGIPWRVGQTLELWDEGAAAKPGPLALVTALAGDKLTLQGLGGANLFQPPAGKLWVRPVATFKWARDNASTVARIEAFAITQGSGAKNRIQVDSLGRDDLTRFAEKDWVEVTDRETEERGEPGTMAQIVLPPDPELRLLVLDRDVGRHETPRGGAIVRRWHHSGREGPPILANGVLHVPGEAPQAADHGLVTIEHAIRARFHGTDLRTGDHWISAARANIGGPLGQIETLDRAPPRGVRELYSRLGIVRWSAAGKAEVDDCRRLFPHLTDLLDEDDSCCTVTVGDGVTTHGDYRHLQEALDFLKKEAKPARLCILRGRHDLAAPALIESFPAPLEIHGCGGGSLVTRAGEPAFVVRKGAPVRFEGLDVATSDAKAAILVERGAIGIHVAGCTVRNDAKTGSTDETLACAAILSEGAGDVEIEDCELHGPLALSLRGENVRLRRSRLVGGVWAREGTRQLLLEDNDVRAPGSPGVILGGTLAALDSPVDAIGVRGVRALGNRIHGCAGSGITTLAGEGKTPLGDVEDVHLAGNRILDCAHARREPLYAQDATGGIVLREAIGVRIEGNEIRGNGRGQAACGVYVEGCADVAIEENDVRDNGDDEKIETRDVTFVVKKETELKNPHREKKDGMVFTGWQDNNKAAPGNVVLPPKHATPGLFCWPRMDVELKPEADAWVEVDLNVQKGAKVVVSFLSGKGEHFVTVHEPGRRTVRHDQPGIHRIRIAGAAANPKQDYGNVAIHAVRVGTLPSAFQGGVVARMVRPGPLPAGVEGDPRRTSRPALSLRANRVDAPYGQTLFATGTGAMLVEHNVLASHAPARQPARGSRPLGACVSILNLGQAPLISRAHLGAGVVSGAHIVRGDLERRIRFPTPMGAHRERGPEGTVRLHGNEVTLRSARGDEEILACVSVVSRGDASLQDNRIACEARDVMLRANCLVHAATARAHGNRFEELPLQARHSYWGFALVHVTTGNHGTHCITTGGWKNQARDNAVLVETHCGPAPIIPMPGGGGR